MSKNKRKSRDKRILKVYAKCGTIRETARRLGHSVNTVRKVLRGESSDCRPPRSSKQPRKSKLDPYRAKIRRLVEEDDFTAVLVLERIRELGYDGGYSILKDYVRQLRPRPNKKPTTPIEHKPGAEAQMDWSPYRVLLAGVAFVVKCFSLVLPFSRYMFIRFALNERLETLIALHDEAFADIGAVPGLCTYDNMTTVGRHIGPGEVWINPRFEAYSKQVDFDVKLITPGKPNQHASVERPFDYIDNNCLKRRRHRFDDLVSMNRYAKWWCDEIANVRIHGTTRQRPVDLLRYERLYLKPLPHHRRDIYRKLERTVGRDFCVRVNNRRYSVHPRHVGKDAVVRLYTERLEIFIDDQLEALHPLAAEIDHRSVLPEHEEAFKKLTPSRMLLEQAFLRLGETARTYYEGLRSTRGRGAGYHLQRILRLADRYGAEVVCGAMAHAARYGNYSADAIAKVISGRALSHESTPDDTTTAPSPQRVQQWLLGIDVEHRQLSDFDAIVDRFAQSEKPDEPEDDDAKE